MEHGLNTAGWLLKKDADWPKRLARTLAPPKKAALKIRKSCFLQSNFQPSTGRAIPQKTASVMATASCSSNGP